MIQNISKKYCRNVVDILYKMYIKNLNDKNTKDEVFDRLFNSYLKLEEMINEENKQ